MGEEVCVGGEAGGGNKGAGVCVGGEAGGGNKGAGVCEGGEDEGMARGLVCVARVHACMRACVYICLGGKGENCGTGPPCTSAAV